MYLNIFLILVLFICLLNMKNSKKINGGSDSNKELNLHKKVQSNISTLRNKLSEINSDIEINKKTLDKYKNDKFTSTTRTQMFETQIILKNLITEKEKTIDLLEKSLEKYDNLLKGGKKIDPLDKIEQERLKNLKDLESQTTIDPKLLVKSKNVTKQVGIVMGESIPSIKKLGTIVVEDVPTSTTNNTANKKNKGQGEVNQDTESDYTELVSDSDDLDSEAANNIAQDIEREQFNDSMNTYIQANSNNINA